MNTQWYAVYTYPQCERKIYNKLTERNIVAYLPTHVVTRLWSDRKKKLIMPLLPNYVFVNVTPKDRYRVLSIEGVTRFVSFGHEPAAISEKEILSLKILVDGNMNIERESFYAI